MHKRKACWTESLLPGRVEPYEIHSYGSMENIILTVSKASVCSIIMAHNHSLENFDPIGAIKQITRRPKEVAALMEILMIDYFIVNQATSHFQMKGNCEKEGVESTLSQNL